MESWSSCSVKRMVTSCRTEQRLTGCNDRQNSIKSATGDCGNAINVSDRIHQIFPTLTATQIARIPAHGRARQIKKGEVLLDVGDQLRFFVVTEGKLDILGGSDSSESLIVTLQPGQFTGELNLLSGRRAFTRIQASEPGEVIEVDREDLLKLIQTDTELSDILLRAFVLRRVELISYRIGGVVVLGSTYSAETLRIREFLTRNSYPYAYVDLDKNSDAQDCSIVLMLPRKRPGRDLPRTICPS